MSWKEGVIKVNKEKEEIIFGKAGPSIHYANYQYLGKTIDLEYLGDMPR